MYCSEQASVKPYRLLQALVSKGDGGRTVTRVAKVRRLEEIYDYDNTNEYSYH